MDGPLHIGMCQLDSTVGDLAGNERKILEGLRTARAAGAQLVLFPELAITGYPPEDLLLKEHFLTDARASLERIAEQNDAAVVPVGFSELGDDAYNARAA